MYNCLKAAYGGSTLLWNTVTGPQRLHHVYFSPRPYAMQGGALKTFFILRCHDRLRCRLRDHVMYKRSICGETCGVILESLQCLATYYVDPISRLANTTHWFKMNTNIDCRINTTCRLPVANFGLIWVPVISVLRLLNLMERSVLNPAPRLKYFTYWDIIPSPWLVNWDSLDIVRIPFSSGSTILAS